MIRSLIFHAGRLDTFFFPQRDSSYIPDSERLRFSLCGVCAPCLCLCVTQPYSGKAGKGTEAERQQEAKKSGSGGLVVFGGPSAAYAIAGQSPVARL